MEIRSLALGFVILMAAGGPGRAQAEAPAPVPESPSAAAKPRMIHNLMAFDNLLYDSEISVDAIRAAALREVESGRGVHGVGLVAATETGVASMGKIFPNWKETWLLYSSSRKQIGFDDWIYEVAFVKQSSRVPGAISEQLRFHVLMDGTAVPVRVSKNGTIAIPKIPGEGSVEGK